jgi:hypothetical protein
MTTNSFSLGLSSLCLGVRGFAGISEQKLRIKANFKGIITGVTDTLLPAKKLWSSFHFSCPMILLFKGNEIMHGTVPTNPNLKAYRYLFLNKDVKNKCSGINRHPN